jgi:filamentous hemagglutinin family protein
MMKAYKKRQYCWTLRLFGWLGITGVFMSCSYSALAQITPDATLGNESSVIIPNQVIQGLPSDQISGGATRGTNLFHSFLEFNIGEGRGVYFANPTGIENILSRVTGNNPSHILGRLGVMGNANLFFLNPNGIVFGSNASLDIKGSFLATTANGIQLGDTGLFSASEPQNSSLISVSPGALFFNQVANQRGIITNSGNLAVGQNFTVSADNLDLQGQLQAGGNLTLQARDTVKVRDSAASPFIVTSGNQLLVQGDRTVNIFALNHPASGFYSGGDMVLRSQSSITGDTHYTTGGNFRIEQLDSSLGNWVSETDPVIRASGDVSFTSYTGPSLHVLAGGAVTIGSAIIIAPDPTNSINDTVTLSNGTPLAVSGGTRPTLDIRAGTTVVTNPLGLQGFPPPVGLNVTGTPTSADITIGSIIVGPAEGLVLLTNQYSPNTTLPGGAIQVGSIITGSLQGNSGDVAIDSRSSIALSDTVDTSSITGNGGNIILLAAEDINTANILSLGLLGGNITIRSNGTLSLSDRFIVSGSLIPLTAIPNLKGGDINVDVGSLSLTNGARLITATLGAARGGDLNVKASESIQLSGNDNGLLSDAQSIPLISPFLSSLSPNALLALQRTQGSSLIAITAGTGTGGNVNIETGRLSGRNGADVGAYVYSQGNGGNIAVNALDSVELIGTSPTNSVGGVFALTYAQGNSGNVTINTSALIARDGSSVSASNLVGTGNGGNLTVNASELVELSSTSPDGKIPSNVSAGSAGIAGESGDLTINTRRLIARNGAGFATTTNGAGRGGNLTVNASDSVELSGESADGFYPTFIATDTFSQLPNAGNAGELKINTERLIVRDGAVVSVSTWGPGRGGNLIVNASETVELSGTSVTGAPSGLFAQSFGAGQAGNLDVTSDRLSVQNGARVAVASTDAATEFRFAISSSLIVGIIPATLADRATGNAGKMSIQARSIQLDNGSLTAASIRAGGGDITVTASDTNLQNSSLISTSVANSTGGGGDITINSGTFIALEDSDILANADEGPGGNITINSPVFLADLFSSGKATAVGRNPGDFARFRGNDRVDISASSRVGIGGTVNVPDFSFLENSLQSLSGNFVNPEQVIANSCLARRNVEQGSFTVTGTGGLPATPYEALSGRYAVTQVQGVSDAQTPQASSPTPKLQTPTSNSWKLGDPVIEARGMTITADGRIIVGTTLQSMPASQAQDLICPSDR